MEGIHMEELYTIDQVARRYGVKHRTVLNWASKGMIHSKKISKRYYFTSQVFEDFEAYWVAVND